MKAYCDKEKIEKLLDGRSVKWISIKLNEIGIKIEYGTFLHLINNRNEWKLTYAMGLCKIFDKHIEDIFYME